MKHSIDLTLSEDIYINQSTLTTFRFEIENASTDKFWIPSYASISNDLIQFEHQSDYYELDEITYLLTHLELLLEDKCPANFEIDLLESDVVFFLNPFGFNFKEFEIRFYIQNHHLSTQFFSVTFEEEHLKQLIIFFQKYIESQKR